MPLTLEEIRKIDPRDRTEEQQDVVNEFHQQRLAEFYRSWGVGNTDEHKTRFWKSYRPGTNVSHFDPGQPEWVRALEMVWLTETFPEDMIFG